MYNTVVHVGILPFHSGINLLMNSNYICVCIANLLITLHYFLG